MTKDDRQRLKRRQFLATSTAAPLLLAAGAFRSARGLAATPACGDAEPTPPQTEGPFFKPRSPQRVSLLDAGMSAPGLIISGRVLSTACRPVTGALLDFWHCDTKGRYDNSGFRFRGHQFADDAGRFRLETMIPGLYPGRTRHIHVKVQAPRRPVLTTQLYFPGEALNADDWIFKPELLMKTDGGNPLLAQFDFVLDLG